MPFDPSSSVLSFSSPSRLLSLCIAVALAGCATAPATEAEEDVDANELASAPPESVVATTELFAQPGAESALASALRNLEEGNGTEPALSYSNVHQDLADRRHFLAIGIWRNSEAFAAHVRSPHAQAFLAAIPPLVAAPPRLAAHDVLGSLDLRRMRVAAADPSTVYTAVFATTSTEEGRREFVRLQADIITVSRRQAGSRFYDFFRATEPRDVTSYEAWTTPEAEQAHLTSAPLQAFAAQVGRLLAGPPRFEHYRSIASLRPAPGAGQARPYGQR